MGNGDKENVKRTGGSNTSLTNTSGAKRNRSRRRPMLKDPGEMVVVIFTFLIDAEHCNFAN
jgi:hypothetical protein